MGRILKLGRALPWKLTVAAACLFRATASAQLATDQVPNERTIPTSQQVQEDVAQSRFRLGPVRLIPGFQLSDAGYDSNVFEIAEGEPTISDWTATIRA